jgi:hypothetical protein
MSIVLLHEGWQYWYSFPRYHRARRSHLHIHGWGPENFMFMHANPNQVLTTARLSYPKIYNFISMIGRRRG